MRLITLIFLIGSILISDRGGWAEESTCQLQTLDQMASLMQEVILKRFPDIQFINQGSRFVFQGDFRDTDYYENAQIGNTKTMGRFFSSRAGVGGALSIEDVMPPESGDPVQLTADSLPPSLAFSPGKGNEDGYFKNLQWSVSVPRLGKSLSVYVFFVRGTPPAFVDDMVLLSRFFGSCEPVESFMPIDEEKATKLARAFARQDTVAREIVQHDVKVFDKNIPGRWWTHHEIIFRGGCCCACDGECDDIIVHMGSDGSLADVKVKHWLCGGRNKQNIK